MDGWGDVTTDGDRCDEGCGLEIVIWGYGLWVPASVRRNYPEPLFAPKVSVTLASAGITVTCGYGRKERGSVGEVTQTDGCMLDARSREA